MTSEKTTFPGLFLSPSLGSALRDWVRLFTGDVERGCSGTTPGRKLKGEKEQSSIRNLNQIFLWGDNIHMHALCLRSPFSFHLKYLKKKGQKSEFIAGFLYLVLQVHQMQTWADSVYEFQRIMVWKVAMDICLSMAISPDTDINRVFWYPSNKWKHWVA